MFALVASSTDSKEHDSGSDRPAATILPLMLLEEEHFVKMLRVERRRSERSGRPFLLIRVAQRGEDGSGQRQELLSAVVALLHSSIRETDALGWYEQDAVLGAMFTELTASVSGEVVRGKVIAALRQALLPEAFARLELWFHLFPQDAEQGDGEEAPALFPDVEGRHGAQRARRIAKRGLDMAGSGLAIALLFPVLLMVALAVKLTSRGAVLFRQARLGQYGRTFTFLKFRSMYTDCDAQLHQEYVTQFIHGAADRHADGNGRRVFKLTSDPRVTPLGRLLRKTSVDELPQFFNVLRGDMSLVGPRPPLLYEFVHYSQWHKRRVLEAKPGITGLWQVQGRSRTSFDDMVRLDLQYIRRASLGMDLKILLQTPRAILGGDGAC